MCMEHSVMQIVYQGAALVTCTVVFMKAPAIPREASLQTLDVIIQIFASNNVIDKTGKQEL